MALARGSSPWWYIPDHVGRPTDDTYFLFVRSNLIPYALETVWHDINGSVPWQNPIRLTAAGTVPQDVYFDEDKVYRLEIRAGDSDADQLVWYTPNYMASSGGGGGGGGSATGNTDNQITNPQFADLLFSTDNNISLTGVNDIVVNFAQGWDFVGVGSGDVVIQRVAYEGDQTLPTNPPYAIQITTTGSWVECYIRQRFRGNGSLWGGSAANASVTVASGDVDSHPLTVKAVYSSAEERVLISGSYTSALTRLGGGAVLPTPTQTDLPSASWLDLRVSVPVNGSVLITSVQVIGAASVADVAYEQEALERQRDHLFHFYKDSILIQPKDSIVTGWNFPLNPWQFRTTNTTQLVGNGGYVCDQTVVITETANSVNVGAYSNPARRFRIQCRTGTAQGRIAVIQYIPYMYAYMGYYLSSLVKARMYASDPQVGIKMCLIHRANYPTVVNPISGWDANGPVFTAGWSRVNPKNDPEYKLPNAGDSSQPGFGAVYQGFPFNSFPAPVVTQASYFALVLYTTAPMHHDVDEAIAIQSISLVPNDFAVEETPTTFYETLLKCQTYYQKSFFNATMPANGAGASNASFGTQQQGYTGGVAGPSGPEVRFNQMMRSVPIVTLYNPLPGGAAGQIANLVQGSSWSGSIVLERGHWGFYTVGATTPGSIPGQQCAVHWTADCRPGVSPT